MSETVEEVLHAADFGTYFDELPLWSAPFGLLMLEHVPLDNRRMIVDIGAGTGFLSLELASRCPAATVVAVDPWTAATTRLADKIERFGVSNVRIEPVDAAELNLPKSSVDLLVSNLGLNNFDNADAVLEHCHGLARPGATLALTTNVTGHMRELYAAFRNVTAAECPSALETLDQQEAHRGTAQSIQTLLQRNGFEPVRTVERSFPMRFANGTALFNHRLIQLGFLPAWQAVIPSPHRNRVFTRLEAELNTTAEAAGELSLTIPMLYLEAQRMDG